MKILEVITSMQAGGAEKLVAELTPLLNDDTHQVDVLLFNGCDTPFLRKLYEIGVTVITLGNGYYDLNYIFKLMPILKKYDIVHTHNSVCQLFVAIAKTMCGAKCKLVTTEHNTDNRRRHIAFFKPIDKWMYRQYDVIISISQEVTDLLLAYIGNGFQVIKVSNGVNVAKYYDAKQNNDFKSSGDVIIIMVAAFRPQKDQETLIKSLSYLPSNYKVWLVGDGVRRQECEGIASAAGVDDRVKFWGVRTDIPQLLKSADVIVMSTHYEGMSLSNIEGMSAGKPFIASDVKGIREITAGAGMLFPEGDSEQLAKEINHLMTDKEDYDAVVDRCLKRAREYDISKTVAGYRSVYDRLYGKA